MALWLQQPPLGHLLCSFTMQAMVLDCWPSIMRPVDAFMTHSVCLSSPIQLQAEAWCRIGQRCCTSQHIGLSSFWAAIILNTHISLTAMVQWETGVLLI